MCSIVKKLGEGASAKVFLLQVNRDKKKYALKIINTGNQDEADAAMSEREAALLLRLKHSQVISCMDAFQKGPHLLLITEFCPLGDLAQHIAARKGADPPCLLSQTQVLQWADNLAQALAYLHQQKILHRDLKPSNIFIAEDSSLKIGDLGIAKEFERTIAKASTFIGTLLYMSPEIFAWQPYSYEADIWSLGCCLHEMMALVYPFWSASRREIFRKIRNAEHSALPEQYSSPLQQLVGSMLQQEPSLRPKADAVVMQLQSLKVAPGVRVRARKRRYLKAKAAEAAALRADADYGTGMSGAMSRDDIFQAVVLYYKQGWEDSELSVDDLDLVTNLSSSSCSSDSGTILSGRPEKSSLGKADAEAVPSDSSSSPSSHAELPQAECAILESSDADACMAPPASFESQTDSLQTLCVSSEQPTLNSSLRANKTSGKKSHSRDGAPVPHAELSPLQNQTLVSNAWTNQNHPLNLTSDSLECQDDHLSQSSVSENTLINQSKQENKRGKKAASQKSSHRSSQTGSKLSHARGLQSSAESQNSSLGAEEGTARDKEEMTVPKNKDRVEEEFHVDAKEVMEWVRSRLESSRLSVADEGLPGTTERNDHFVVSEASSGTVAEILRVDAVDCKQAVAESAPGEEKRKKKKKRFLLERKKKVQESTGEDVGNHGDKSPRPTPLPRTVAQAPRPPPTPPPRVKTTVDDVTGKQTTCPVRLYTRSQQVTFVNVKTDTGDNDKPEETQEERWNLQKNRETEEDGWRLQKNRGTEEDGWRLQKNRGIEEDGQRVEKNRGTEEDGQRVEKNKGTEEDGERVEKSKGTEEDRQRLQKNRTEEDEQRLLKNEGTKEDELKLQKNRGTEEDEQRLLKNEGTKEDELKLQKNRGTEEDEQRLLKNEGTKEDELKLQKNRGTEEEGQRLLKNEGLKDDGQKLQKDRGTEEDEQTLQKNDGSEEEGLSLQTNEGAEGIEQSLLKNRGTESNGQSLQRNGETDQLELERAMLADLGETTLEYINLLIRVTQDGQLLQAQLRDFIGWQACEKYLSIIETWAAKKP